jgi:D-alanine-D-alanine ligase
MRIAVISTVGAPCGCAEAVMMGLHALGHESVVVDSAEIEHRAAEISESCDLVIDHTDTFRGTGLLRPFVRGLLETHGARIVGSDARACFRADNKAATKACWSNAGIPVPPGIVATSEIQDLPAWLRAPVVLKPAFEHMSRGLHVAATEAEIHSEVAALLDRFGQPVLVEAFIPGRELAVSLLEEKDGLYMLPPLEWRIQSGDHAVLTEVFKRSNVPEARQDFMRVELPDGLSDDLRELSMLAFRALGLRDYARFDVRLSAAGTFYFLEANTTPSLEPQEALALSARWAGWSYPVLVEKMLSAALRRYDRSPLHEDENMHVALPTGPVDLVIPAGVHSPPASTWELAALLDVQPGERVLDLGCGTGLLAIAAAKLGADHVVAADIDPRALAATKKNAMVNGVAERIEVRAGAWYEALNGGWAGHAERFDLIVATPPQTPGHYAFGSRYGGHDGTHHLRRIIEGAADYLKPESGRLWLLAISLANPSELLRRLRDRFDAVRIVHSTERRFTEQEYESVATGLMGHLLALRASGRSEFADAGGSGYAFKNLFICARGVKAP